MTLLISVLLALALASVMGGIFGRMVFFLVTVILVAVAVATTVNAQTIGEHPHIEMRYCGEPPRGKLGEILRDKTVVAAFKRVHPCPSTGKTVGACNGWAIDHVIPMACGGCDAVSNMQWLPDSMKNHSGITPKDRWERQVYAYDNLDGSPRCKFKIQK